MMRVDIARARLVGPMQKNVADAGHRPACRVLDLYKMMMEFLSIVYSVISRTATVEQKTMIETSLQVYLRGV